jgi:hypothetical protein
LIGGSFYTFLPCLLVPRICLSLLSFGEGVKDRAGCHPRKAAEEGEVIGFSQMRIANPGEELNDFS